MSVLAHPTPETTATLINYPPPTWLKHTPLVMLPYESFDGPYVPGGTDAKYLSVGLAQWREDAGYNQSDISVKSWRKPNERWSRESEEVPIHRNVDMTILLSHFVYNFGKTDDITLPSETFENQKTPIVLKLLEQVPSDSVPYIERCRSRLRALRDILNELDPPG
jgi:hypothetical protein